MLNRIALVFLGLYILALHVSMAGMEIFSSLLLVCALLALATKKVSFRTEFQTPILIYCGFLFLNTLLTPSVGPWIERVGELRWIFVYWSLTKILEMVWNEKSESKLKGVWALGLVLASALGVYQFFTGLDPVRHSSIHLVPTTGDVFRATGFFSLCLTFAYSMGISGMTLSLPSVRLHKMAPILVLTASGIAVITSMTRGAWVGYAVASLFLLLPFTKIFKRSHWAALIGLSALAGGSFLATSGGADRIHKLINFRTEGSFVHRLDLWNSYFHMFLDNPVLGVGYRQGSDFLMEYFKRFQLPWEYVTHAHNDYIQALAETGFIGFSLFLFLAAYTIKKTWDLRRLMPMWGSALLAGQVYMFVGSLSQANFTDAEVNHFLMFNWALTSFLLASHTIKKTVASTP